jgi:DNA polymerase III delta prime subunit
MERKEIGNKMCESFTKLVDWADIKYRPKSLEEMVGNKRAFERLKAYVASGNWTHLLLYGRAGVGKTVAAEIFARSFDAEIKEWNFDEESGVRIIREQVIDFARSKSIDKPFKISILDEVDRLSKIAQESLREPMVKNSNNCRFILISNTPGDITEHVFSRVFSIRFAPLKPEEILSRLEFIAEKEKLEKIITKKQLLKIAESSKGDVRRAIKALQGLCEGQTNPIEDSDMEQTFEELEIASVRQAITLAFQGKLSEAIFELENAFYQGLSPEEIINKLTVEMTKSKFNEKQKTVVGRALLQISGPKIREFHLYGLLAYVADKWKRDIQDSISHAINKKRFENLLNQLEVKS